MLYILDIRISGLRGVTSPHGLAEDEMDADIQASAAENGDAGTTLPFPASWMIVSGVDGLDPSAVPQKGCQIGQGPINVDTPPARTLSAGMEGTRLTRVILPTPTARIAP